MNYPLLALCRVVVQYETMELERKTKEFEKHVAACVVLDCRGSGDLYYASVVFDPRMILRHGQGSVYRLAADVGQEVAQKMANQIMAMAAGLGG